MKKKRADPEEDLARIRRSTLMDDAYMRQFFADSVLCAELVLQIIMGRKLTVRRIKTQRMLRGPEGSRSVCLDLDAQDEEDYEYDVELQRGSVGARPQRARYHSAMLDVNLLKAREDFSELRKRRSVVIFITEEDVLGKGKPIYFIERVVRETGEPFNDGSYIIYVNASMQDETTALGRLMHDFTCPDADKMYYPLLAERTRFFKENKEGIVKMSGVWEEMREEVTQRVTQEVTKRVTEKVTKQVTKQTQESLAVRMLQAGQLALKDIANYSGLTLARVRQLSKKLA